MDELGGLVGGLVVAIAVIYAVVALIAIVVVAAVCVTLVVGPPLGLGTILKRFLTQRYRLSARKRWECAGITCLTAALPSLALLVDNSLASQLAVAWAGAVMGMSSLASFLALSAYRQYFAQHRHSIRQAGATLIGETVRHTVTALKMSWLNGRLERAERRHGRLLRAQETLTAAVDALAEKGDPALCRIKITHWENQYGAMPPRALCDALDTVSGELATVPESHRVTTELHTRFLEMQILSRKLARHQGAGRYHQLKAERDELQNTVARCTETISACRRLQVEKSAKIADLKRQRLLIQ